MYTADPSQTKPVIYNQNNEVTFSVINHNKIIAPFGDVNAGVVNLRFHTNEKVDPEDRYLVQLKFKEEVLAFSEV
jgi:hypothetical protein